MRYLCRAESSHGRTSRTTPHWSNSIEFSVHQSGNNFSQTASFKAAPLRALITVHFYWDYMMCNLPKLDFTSNHFGQHWKDFRRQWNRPGLLSRPLPVHLTPWQRNFKKQSKDYKAGVKKRLDILTHSLSLQEKSYTSWKLPRITGTSPPWNFG